MTGDGDGDGAGLAKLVGLGAFFLFFFFLRFPLLLYPSLPVSLPISPTSTLSSLFHLYRPILTILRPSRANTERDKRTRLCLRNSQEDTSSMIPPTVVHVYL
mmetsp:Transcript_66471/g.144335  ORF Transcript_66471/g.144335 Transcript_66471/m.144335 type:complete len:102 (+) Transcript_66471:1824-2129(+)